jgi:hypothetical protein
MTQQLPFVPLINRWASKLDFKNRFLMKVMVMTMMVMVMVMVMVMMMMMMVVVTN